jgi:hypothetical protein
VSSSLLANIYFPSKASSLFFFHNEVVFSGLQRSFLVISLYTSIALWGATASSSALFVVPWGWSWWIVDVMWAGRSSWFGSITYMIANLVHHRKNSREQRNECRCPIYLIHSLILFNKPALLLSSPWLSHWEWVWVAALNIDRFNKGEIGRSVWFNFYCSSQLLSFDVNAY